MNAASLGLAAGLPQTTLIAVLVALYFTALLAAYVTISAKRVSSATAFEIPSKGSGGTPVDLDSMRTGGSGSSNATDGVRCSI